MEPTAIDIAATACFALAVLHTFAVKQIQHAAHRFPEGSVGENLLHLLGEVEIVFGLWAAAFFSVLVVLTGPHDAVAFIDGINFTEPLFVFAIMAMAGSRPILWLTRKILVAVPNALPALQREGFYVAALVLGPLLGSFITEPAAMTVTALALRERFFTEQSSERLKYVTLAVLLVNVSIGGTMTQFAAPPVLMVAATWQWDLPFMFMTFGWKAALACVINAAGAAYLLRKELAVSALETPDTRPMPVWVAGVHVVFLAFLVWSSHHPAVFLGAFLFFIGFAMVTREYQDELRLRDSLLVAFFLGGLVVLGSRQAWWLAPLLASLGELPLFLGATALTAITDNAALTYLGAQVEGISDSMKYALVAGAVAGGGLTVIANAPNPAGFAILRDRFGADGISPIGLITAALVPTLVAMASFWFL